MGKIDKFINVMLVILLLWATFMAGRLYEVQKWKEWRDQKETERVISRHKYHGIWGSIEENGKRYFVRDPKDHENRAKWVRL